MNHTTETPALPDKKYNIIYADPPWQYNARNNPHTKFSRGVHGHYPTMTTESICELPVSSIADDNCALVLWITWPRLLDGIQVLQAWGFKYVTLAFNWFKTNQDGSPFFGVGYYSKSNSEVALLGIKGRMKPVSNYVSQVVISAREKHSKKPDSVRDKIVELFARSAAEGWDCWGNEAPNTEEEDAWML